MDVDEEKLHLAGEFTSQCLLPEFNRDIGDQPLERDDLNVFVYGLNQNLRLLFDIIAKNESLLIKPFEETETFHTNLILLLNEQSGFDDSPFQTDDQFLLKHLRTLVDKYYQKILKNHKIYEKCLEYYKQRLTAQKWKRNIGAVYGYVRFCELHHVFLKSKLGSNDGLFMLSVGMLLVEYFEHHYKRFGLKLFLILMEMGDQKFLIETNIFEAIYNKLMNPLIVIIKDEATTGTLLECLYKCIENELTWQQQPSDWNKIDDILEEILKRIGFETDGRCISMLFLFISKLTTLPIKANMVVQDALSFSNVTKTVETSKINERNKSDFDCLRAAFQNYNNLLIYRWTKKLLELFSNQTFLGKLREIKLQLQAIHLCYLSCVFGIPTMILGQNWITFVDSLVPNLINLIKNNIEKEFFLQDVKEILETLSLQVQNNAETMNEKNKDEFDQINQSIEKLRCALC